MPGGSRGPPRPLLDLLATLRHQRRVLVQALLDHPEHRHCCGVASALLANSEATEIAQELAERG